MITGEEWQFSLLYLREELKVNINRELQISNQCS
jgi:hypothetical protein